MRRPTFNFLAASCIAIVAALAALVFTETLAGFDLAAVRAAAAYRNASLFALSSSVTALGSPAFVIGLSLFACILFFLFKKRSDISGLLVSALGAAGTDLLIKMLVARARPDASFAAYFLDSYSFPSGHAAIAVALYGFLGLFVVRHLKNRALKWICGIITIVLIGMIGLSRLALGVHYPTDIIAGYALGTFWALLGARIAREIRMVRPRA